MSTSHEYSIRLTNKRTGDRFDFEVGSLAAALDMVRWHSEPSNESKCRATLLHRTVTTQYGDWTEVDA